jgi:hypothetical protein
MSRYLRGRAGRGTRDADVPASLYPLLHSEVRKRTTQYALQSLCIPSSSSSNIATADAGSLTSRLLLVCEGQQRRALGKSVKRHPHVFPCECQEWYTRRVLRGAEQRMSLL